jgi:hypothetical protein
MDRKKQFIEEHPSLWNSIPDPSNLKMDSDKLPQVLEQPRISPQSSKRRSKKENVKALQDLLLKEGLWAVKRAGQFVDDESFIADLEANLSQNSAETRKRYATSLIKWFFPDGPQGFVSKVWINYQDEVLQYEILRALYLRVEPIVGNCIADALFPIQDGSTIPSSYLVNFLRTNIATDVSEKTISRLKMNLRKLGFLYREKNGKDTLRSLNPSSTAFFLVFHFLFAKTETTSVELRNILSDPFWKHLGYKSEDTIRKIFKSAEHQKLLSKYIVADRLESVTTRYSLMELLERKVRP